MSGYKGAEINLRTFRATPRQETTSRLNPLEEQLVMDLVGRVSDKWTMIVLKVLTEVGEIQFCQLASRVHKIRTRTLINTLCQMECDGLVRRLVPTVKPPRADYRMMDYQLTETGKSLGVAFCNVWVWAEDNLPEISSAPAVPNR